MSRRVMLKFIWSVAATLFVCVAFYQLSGSTTKRFDNDDKLGDSLLRPASDEDLRRAECLDAECRSFLRLIESTDEVDWPNDKPRAVIYYLTVSSRLESLNESLRLLDANFNAEYRYPIIVFYEELDRGFDVELVRTFSVSTLFFQQVSFDIPVFVNRSAVPQNGCLDRFSVGYRHMCRFHARLVYEQPIMASPRLRYALRLDDDSLILRPVGYDLFRAMRDTHSLYGYVLRHFEHFEQCVAGLWPTADRYIEDQRIDAPFYRQWEPRAIFYNNFELSALAFWRSVAYRKWIEHVDRTGGIYYHRWGDAPIKTIAVTMLVPPDRVRQFTDITYSHQSKWSWGSYYRRRVFAAICLFVFLVGLVVVHLLVRRCVIDGGAVQRRTSPRRDAAWRTDLTLSPFPIKRPP